MVYTVHRRVHLLVLTQFGIQFTVHGIKNVEHQCNNFVCSNIVITPLNFCVDVEHQSHSEKPFSSLNVCYNFAGDTLYKKGGEFEKQLYTVAHGP
jgi:hypothetical protein